MSHGVNVGIVGTGFVQDNSHLPAFSEIKNVNVVAVAGTTREKSVAFAERWNIGKSYYGAGGIEKLCCDPDVDVIDIGIPNHLHLPTIITAAENHKHVICEKPLGRNAAEAKEALATVERYKVLHCYAENQVFMPQVSRAMQFIESGGIGELTSIRAREAHSGPHSKWFWDPELAGGGVLLDMGCHSIEVVRHLLSRRRPLEIGAWTATLVHETKAEDNSLVLVKYDGGALGQCENSWSAKGGVDVRMEIYGRDGVIFIDVTRETGIKVFTGARKDRSTYIVEKADASEGWMFPVWREHEVYGFLDELRHFVDCIARGIPPTETFADGLIVNQIMDSAYLASRDKKWVQFSP